MLKTFILLFAIAALAGCSSDGSRDHQATAASHAHVASHGQKGKETHSHPHDSSNFDFQKIKSEAEENARTFDPGFVRSFHQARVYTIRDYNIVDSVMVVKDQHTPVLKRVAGDIPDQNSTGSFEVTILDEKDNIVYQYRMESPLYVRTEHGPDKGLFKVKAGSFLVPLPSLENAAKIVLKDDDGTELVSTFR